MMTRAVGAPLIQIKERANSRRRGILTRIKRSTAAIARLETFPEPSMTEPIAAWHADHVNFARLLNLLERQLITIHAGSEPDYAVMLAVAYYLRHYPDRVHHPREDVAFARLVERDPALELPIARRLQEHRVIAAAGEELLGLLQRVVEGEPVKRSAIETAVATYLVYYRHHLAAEEREVIPRAAQLLTPADWAAVGAARAGPDPLFGELDPRYRELHRQIEREAVDTDQG